MRKWLGSAVYVMKHVSLSILRHTLYRGMVKNNRIRLRDLASWPRMQAHAAYYRVAQNHGKQVLRI